MLWPFATTWRPLGRGRRGTDLRWLTARSWTRRWYPQGIDVGVWRGRRMLAVSWFRQRLDGRHLASRIAMVDLDRSRHLDVFLAVDDEGSLQPATIHAGGLAWFGDRLYVAATGRGIWEFDLAAVRHVRGAEAHRVAGGGRGPTAHALVAVRTRVHPIDLRCSYLGRVYDAAGAPLQRVMIGEYSADTSGRLAEFALDERGLVEHDRFAPGIAEMQGAVRLGDRYLVSQSDGLRPGSLWTGTRDRIARSHVALPVGCEDLALDPERRVVWTLGEHPWRRVVRRIGWDAIGL